MEVGDKIFDVFVRILRPIDLRLNDQEKCSSGCKNLPCKLLSSLIGNGVEYNFNWAADNLLHFGEDVGVPVNDMCSPK